MACSEMRGTSKTGIAAVSKGAHRRGDVKVLAEAKALGFARLAVGDHPAAVQCPDCHVAAQAAARAARCCEGALL